MNPRTWREQKELSLAAMGQLVGVTPPAIQRYERGERFPSPDAIEAYRVATDGAVTYEDFAALRREKAQQPSQGAA